MAFDLVFSVSSAIKIVSSKHAFLYGLLQLVLPQMAQFGQFQYRSGIVAQKMRLYLL